MGRRDLRGIQVMDWVWEEGGGQFQIALKTPNREKKLRKKTTSIRCTYSGRQTDQSQSKDSARGEVSLL